MLFLLAILVRNYRSKTFKVSVFDRKATGAKIIVFPEYGLFFPHYLTSREDIYKLLEEIPDPIRRVNPCRELGGKEDFLIQHTLSCIAKNYSLYLIANIGAKENCPQNNKQCTQNGVYHFNANVAYSPSGVHLGRYFKKNLRDFEKWYDVPTSTVPSCFKTPYGTIGMLISYDIFNSEVAIDLIENRKIDIIALSSVWINTVPFHAIPFHASWASIMGITLFVSNLKNKDDMMFGSGIYTPYNVLKHSSKSYEDELLMASLDILSTRRDITYFPDVKLSRLFIREAKEKFKAYIDGVNYTMSLLNGRDNEAKTKICLKNFCCFVIIKNKAVNVTNFAVGIYRGNSKGSENIVESCL
ncbi:DgyrCDS13419 [Dimorphilus gyrociliatus]|uniref:DgyrCDS13419 n=1 Tax=Dimorphilus gyrociliatus TaxID=2664684 RepID=A0A7I8WAQ0_9ANNE|nr:DgyrCDS13419 [Dimorphilus gyrociliatus]